jgi:AcrR family transcriptional regulator
MRSIIFTSTATRPLDDEELLQILEVGREQNVPRGVTGILMHSATNFLGILEGPESIVRSRFEQVHVDPRHADVRLLFDEQIEKRSFTTWSLALHLTGTSLRGEPGLIDMSGPVPFAGPLGMNRQQGIVEWFRKHPLAPFSSRTAIQDVALRVDAIDCAMTASRTEGSGRISIEAVAAQLDIDPHALRRHYPTDDALRAAIIEQSIQATWRALLPLIHDEGTVAFLRALMRAGAEDPSLMALCISSFAAAAEPTASGADYYRSVYRRFLETIREGLERDIQNGREPSTMNPVRGARQLVALFDGFRLQAALAGDEGFCGAFDRAVTQIRRDWADDDEGR